MIMYELVQVAENTYYIDCPAKIGVCRTSAEEVWLIDSGNDKDAGRRILKILDANGWTLKGIINTHSNADHVGGNHFLQQRTGCQVISTEMENAFAKFPVLEPSFLYGGYPVKELRNKFLLAAPSEPTGTLEDSLPEGFGYLPLGGHYFDMAAVRTPDNVWFLADCLFGEATVQKYHISFIYDVRAFLQTLDQVERLEGEFFVPAHAQAGKDMKPLAALNRSKVLEIAEKILELCREPLCFEAVLQKLFDAYGLKMDFNQYVLVGSTVRSYLAYLHDEGKLKAEFIGNQLLWESANISSKIS